jgi:hypothetical protein
MEKSTKGQRNVPITPVSISATRINMPYGSDFENVYDALFGSSPARILPPSRGSNGNRLNTIKMAFTKIPALATSNKNRVFVKVG